MKIGDRRERDPLASNRRWFIGILGLLLLVIVVGVFVASGDGGESLVEFVKSQLFTQQQEQPAAPVSDRTPLLRPTATAVPQGEALETSSIAGVVEQLMVHSPELTSVTPSATEAIPDTEQSVSSAEEAEPSPAVDDAEQVTPVPPTSAPAALSPSKPPATGPGFLPIPYLSPDVMKILQDGQQQIWIVTKYEAAKVLNGDPDSVVLRLNQQAFRYWFDRGMQALATAHITPQNHIWIGGWHGEVFHYREGGEWKEVALEIAPGRRKVTVLLPAGDDVYLSRGQGLWHWNRKHMTLEQIPELKDERPSASVATPDGRLFVGGMSGVWELQRGQWRVTWSLSAQERGVKALSTAGNSLYIATSRGLVELNLQGYEHERMLGGVTVTDAARDAAGRLWVGSQRKGLFMREGSTWYGSGRSKELPGDYPVTLLADQRGRLWCGFYGKGTFYAPIEQLAEWLKSQKIVEKQAFNLK